MKKPKEIIFFCFMICLYAITNSFAGNTDSLKNVLDTAIEDTNKVNILLKIADNLFDDEPSKAREYAQKAKILSEKLNYIQGLSGSLDLIGALFYYEGDLNTALTYLMEALQIIQKSSNANQHDLLQVYLDIGNVYLRQADYIEAVKYYLKGSKISEKIGSARNNAVVLMNLGLVYKKQKKFSEALAYYNKSVKLFESIDDWRTVIDMKNNIASVYLGQELYEKALEMSLGALRLSEKHDAKHGISNSCSFIGLSYFQLKNYHKAVEYYEKALKVEEELNDQFSIALLKANFAKVYLETNELNKSIEYFNKAFLFFKENDMKNEMKDVYKNLSEVYEKQKNFQKSIQYYKQYSDLKDSIYNEDNSKQINGLYAKYESEKKEKEIALLNADVLSKEKDKQILSAQIEKRNSIIFGTTLGAILLLASIILLFNRRQLKQKNKHQADIFKEQENTAISILQAQEKERTRIAKDLHDSVGTFLSTLKINLQLFEGGISKEKMASYQSAIELIDKIAVELRNIMKNLSDETLQEQGLVGAFEELIERINRLGAIQFNFQSHGLSDRPEGIIETNLYRVGQELLSNCVKYASASNGTLQLIARENKILLMLEDNGTGFDFQNPKISDKDHGMGLKNVRDRISFIKGTLHVESSAQNGTTIIIEAPHQLN